MASLGTLLGTGTSTGGAVTMTVTCVASQNASERVHLFSLVDHSGGSLQQSQVSAISDSVGGTWTLATSTLAMVGHTDETDGVALERYLIASFIRTAGSSLTSGDTITVTFLNTGSHPPPSYGLAIIQGFLGVTDNAVKQGLGDYGAAVDITPSHVFNVYSNGDSYASGDPDQLLWRVDYAGLHLNPAPAENCAYIGLFGSLNGSGFTPDELGSTVRELTNGPLYLALVFAPLVSATGIGLEPGGTFTGAASTVGNYQFVELASGFRAWQRF